MASDHFTLSDLMTYFSYDSSILVVEYNKFICPKSKWTEIFITNNDNIEVISIVGGG